MAKKNTKPTSFSFFYRSGKSRTVGFFGRRNVPQGIEPAWEFLPKLLTLRATANLLHVHPNTLRQWDASGKLRAVRLGARRDRRFDREQVAVLWRRQHIPARPRLLSRLAESPSTVRHWRAKSFLAAALVLSLLGLLQQTTRAQADSATSPATTVEPTSCIGWAQAERATVIDLGEHPRSADFTDQNSAFVGSDGRAVQADLEQDGVVSGGLESATDTLTCRGFSVGTVTPVTAELVLSLRLDGQPNSTDDVAIRTSYDGSTWTTAKVLPLSEPMAGQITLPLSVVDSAKLTDLQVQVAAETDPTRWVSRVWLDGLALRLAVPESNEESKAVVPAAGAGLDRLVTFSRQTYRAAEQPVVTVPKKVVKKFMFIPVSQETWQVKSLELIDHRQIHRRVTYHQADVRRSGSDVAQLTIDTQNLHAGRYQLEVTMTNSAGESATIDKDFLWGVVAMNVTHAIARPGDNQVVGIGILDDDGRTICDADLQLTVTDPNGQKTTYSSAKKTVTTSGVCVDKGVTNVPDYSVMLKPTVQGLYRLHLEASTRAGQRIDDDTFQVDQAVNFEVERFDFPTRIFPPAPYPVRLAVTPSEDYRGTVREQLPASFSVSQPFPDGRSYVSTSDPSTQYLEWTVDWKRGETYFLGYTFDAPDISPALFSLGPLEIGGSFVDQPAFKEPRQWQLASDAVNIRVQGTLYSNEGTTAIDCSAANKTVKLEVNNTASYSATCTLATGAYDFGTTISVNASDVLTIYISGATEKGSRTTRVAATPADITGADIYQNRAIVSHEDTGPITNTNLDNWDGGNDADVPYTVTAGALTVASGRKLIVWTGKTFTPGGSVTTTAASNQSNPDGDLDIQATATLSMGTNALSVGGDYNNAGSFSKSTGQTTTFTGTTTGFTIAPGTGNFDSVTFNGVGGGWSNSAAMTIDAALTMTNGTLSGTNNVTVITNVAGTSGTINLTGGTFKQRVTTGRNFGTTSGSNAWTFYNLTFSNSGSGISNITTQSGGTGDINVTNVLTLGEAGDSFATGLYAQNRNWYLSGSGTPFVTNAGGTLFSQTSTFIYSGSPSSVTIAAIGYNNLTVGLNDANSVTYVVSAAYTATGTTTVSTGDTLTCNANCNVGNSSTGAGTLVLDGTINGSSFMQYYSNTAFPTGGTMNLILWMNGSATGGQTLGARTYGGGVQLLCWCAETITFASGTIQFNSYLRVAENSNGVNYTVDAATNDPTVNVTGDVDYNGNSGTTGVEILNAGAGTWTVGGNVDFNDSGGAAGQYNTETGNLLKMTGTTKTINTGGNSLLNFEVASGGSNNVTMSANTTVSGDLTITSGALTAPSSGTLTIGGTFTNNSTFTHNSSTVTMNGTSKNIAGSSNTAFNSLTISGTITLTASNPTIATLLTVDVSKSLTINSGLTVALTRNNASDSLTLNGTINGPGRLTYRNATANSFTTSGTLASSLIVRFDTVNGNLTIPARTDYGAIEAYGASANARTVTLGTVASQTITASSYFYVIADAVSPNNVTVSATTNNPTVNIGGDLYYTGTNTASEVIQSGTGTWTVSGSVNFTDGTYTATSGTTLAMNGTSKTLTSASQSLYNFTVSGGSVTVGDTTTITNDLSVTGGTMSGTSNITVNGNATGTAGTVNLTGGTFEQRVSASKNFGPTTASTNWTFSTLTFSNSNAGATPITITAQSCSTCGVTVSSVLNIGKSGDAAGATTTLDAGDKTWTLSGSGTPLALLGSPAAVFTANTSTVKYSSTTAPTLTNVTYYNLTLAPSGAGGPTYVLPSGTLTINNNLTVGDGTNAVTVSNTTNNTVVNVSADLTVNASGTLSGSGTGTFTINGNVTGAGTVNLSGNTFEQRVAAAKNFGASGGSNAWAFNNLIFSNSHASTAFTVTYQTGGTGDTSVAGTLTVSKVGDAATTTLSLASGRTLTSGTAGTVTINSSGTISGSGTLIVQNSNLGTGGTLSSVVRFDATGGNVTAPARTYGGNVEAYSNSSSAARSVILGSGTQALSGTLTVTANNTQNLTLDGATNDPTLNLTGNLSMSKPSTGTPIITAPDTGSVTWTMSGSVDFSNGTYTKGTETLTMNGTGTLTTNSNSLNNFTTSGSGTITLANATHTIAGNLNLGSSATISAGSSTVTMSGTSKTIDGGGQTLSNLTISGTATLQNTDLTASGTLNVADAKTMTVNVSRTLTLSGNSGTTLNLNTSGTVTGSGTLVYQNSATTVTTAGTLSSAFTFDLLNGNETIPNRTFGGLVTGQNTTSSARTLLFGASVTPTFSVSLDVKTTGTGTLLLDGATNNPTSVTVTGNVTASAANGAITVSMGSGTWSVSGNFDLTNVTTFNHNSGSLTLNGTGTLTSNGKTLNNLTTSGSGTITLANATHTLAGNLNLGSSATLTAGTSTVAMTGATKTIDGGGKTLSGLTISGDTTLQNTDLTVSGTLQVDNTKTLTINVSRTLTHSGATLTLNGTITGAGTYVYQSSTAFPTGGTISSLLRFDATNNDQIVSARPYVGQVELYSNSSSAVRTITLGTASLQTLTFSSHLYVNAANSQDLKMEGSTYHPTVNITGDFKATGTGSGMELLIVGDGTWTVSANVDISNGFYAPRYAELNPTWDNFGSYQEDYLDDGFGGCVFGSSQNSCGTASATTFSAGNTLNSSGGQVCPASDFYYRAYLKYDLSSIANTNTIIRADQRLNVTSAGGSPNIGRSNNDSPDGVACGSLYAVGASVAYNNFLTWGAGTSRTNMNITGSAGVQSRLGTTSYGQVIYSGQPGSTITSTDSALNKPLLQLGYVAASTTPTLVMNGTGTLTAGTAGFYNLTLSGTNTVSATSTTYIYGTFDMSGTVTNNTFALVMAGSSGTLKGGGNTIGNLTVYDNATITLTTSDLTLSNAIAVNSGGTLSLGSGRTITLTGSTFTLTGTISGSGTFVYANGGTFPTTGTISTPLRFDVTNGNETMSARTYGGAVEAYNNHATLARTVTLAAGTPTLSSTLTVTSNNGGNITLAGATNNPTVNLTGDLSFTKNSTGTVTLTSGTGTWTASGNVNFTNGTYTATSGNTLVMNGTSKTLTSASQSLYNFTVSGGSVTVGDATTITNDLSVTGGTMSGTSNITVNGNATGTAGTVNLTGGTFEQRVSAGKNFGPTTASTSWTFSTLTFSNSHASSGITVTAQSCSTCGVTVSTALNIGKNTDAAGATTTLSAGDKTWTLSGSGTSVMVLATSPAATFTASTSTINYTGSSATTTAAVTYNNLGVGTTSDTGAGVTYTLGGNTTVSGTLTVGNAGSTNTDTLAGSSYTLTLSGSVATPLTLTAKGTFSAGTSTVNYTSVNGGGNVNVTTATYSGLTVNPSSAETYDLAGNSTASGTLNVGTNATLSIANGVTLTHSGATLTLNGTISGSGTYVYQSSTAFPTSGTISSILRFDATNNNQIVSARASGYGGQVELYNNSSSAARTVTFGTAASQTITFSSHLYLNAANTQDLTLDGQTNSPTVNITGDLDFTGAGTGTEVIAAGDGTWTVSGSVNLTSGIYAPHIATLSPAWDQTSIDAVLNTESPPGSCSTILTFSCESDTALTLSAGFVDGSGGAPDCLAQGAFTNYFYRHGMRFSLSTIPSTATVTAARLGANVSSTTSQTMTVGRATKDDPTTDACNTAARFNDLNPTAYDNTTSWGTTGRKDINLKALAVTDIQSRLTGSNTLAIAVKGDETTNAVGSINSNDNSTFPPVLRVGYATTGTTPTLAMNGTGTLTADLNGFYNLTLSGTVTLGDASGSGFYLYGTLNMTGGTVTAGSGTVVTNNNNSQIVGGGQTLSNLTVANNTTTTLSTSNLTVSGAATVGTGGTLSLNSVSLTISGTLALSGTASGTGTLIFTDTSSGPGTAGTLTAPVRFDATNGDIAPTTLDARTYGGAVELYSNSGTAKTVNTAAGTYVLSSTLTLTKAGAGGLTFDMNTTDPTTFTVTGALSVGTGTTLSATSSGTFNVNGNYTNNGTFTDNSGTVTLAGSSQQTLSGTMTGGSDFNNLAITNSSGSDPDSSPSVIFGAAADTAGTFTAATNDVKIRFNAGSTYALTAINFTGTSGHRVYLHSSTGGTQWNINAGAGARTVTYTSVKDSNACGSTGGSIDASDGTNVSESGNNCWTIATLQVTLSANSVALGSLSPSTVTKGSITSTITSSAPSGYVSLVKYDQTLTSGSNTIADAGGSITQGTAGYGVSTSKASQTIAQTTGACTSGSGTFNASSLTTTYQLFASASSTASSDATTLCFLATPSITTVPGAYSSTATLVTTAKF